MRHLFPLAFSLIGLVSAVACSSGDDNGDPAGDGSGTSVDGGIVEVSQLGSLCSMEVQCPADVPICAVLPENPNEGFCTKDCGTTPLPPEGQQPMAPMGGDALCRAGYTGTATPLCALTFQPDVPGTLPWGCGLACGPDGGECPSNLRCLIMQGAANGFCLP